MGSPSNSGRTTPTVDASDRKFYIQAAERSPEGKEALDRFDAALTAQNSSPPARSNSGATGGVTGVQSQLNALGYDTGGIDGIAGRKTDQAIRDFQQANGLAVDGIIGPQTQAALAAAQNPAPSAPAAEAPVAAGPAMQNTASSGAEHVAPKRAEDPSDQKFYNMATDRQNTKIDLENRSEALHRDIDALGTSGGYVTSTLQTELDEVENELDGYRALDLRVEATEINRQLDGLRTDSFSGYVRPELQAQLNDVEQQITDVEIRGLERERRSVLQQAATPAADPVSEDVRQEGLARVREIDRELLVLRGEVPQTLEDLQNAHENGLFRAPTGDGDSGGTFGSDERVPFAAYGDNGSDRGQAAISRFLVDTSVGAQIQNDEFEIVHHGNGNYTVVLPGVTDLSQPQYGLNPDNQTVRDIDQFALPSSHSSSIDDNRYAQLVQEYITNNVPQGANVMLVGHSFGADTALDLASDPSFNNAETGVNVTHVVAAAYYSQPQISDVENNTQVLVLQNRQDVPVIAEGLGYAPQEIPGIARGIVGGAGDYARETISDAPSGASQVFGFGTSLLRGDLGGATAHAGNVVNGIRDNGSPVGVPDNTIFSLADAGVTSPNDNTIVARFDGGFSRAGHGQEHYTGFVNGTDDASVRAFFDSVAQNGYAENGRSFAVDVSLNDPNFEPTYPGQDTVDQGRSIWNRIPGNDLIDGPAEFLATDGASFAFGKVSEVASAVTGDDTVGELVDAVPYRNSISAAGQALLGRDEITLDQDAVNLIQNDPAFVEREAAIVQAIQGVDGYGETALSIPISELDGIPTGLELGGQRGQSDLGEQFRNAYDLSDPNVRATWDVAGNDLTWLLRHANVDGTAQVDPEGNITISYEVNDVLDLRPGEGRNEWYNRITSVTGTVWHDVLGAEESRVVGNFETNPTTSRG